MIWLAVETDSVRSERWYVITDFENRKTSVYRFCNLNREKLHTMQIPKDISVVIPRGEEKFLKKVVPLEYIL